MLWRKLLMVAEDGQRATHWIIPGGRVFHIVGGQLVEADPANGWPEPAPGGDPFTDSEGRAGTYEQLFMGGGVGEIRAVRLRDTSTDRELPRSLGPYRGWASDKLTVGMSDTGVNHPSNPYGYSRPSWTMTAQGAGSAETGYTADWPWEMQSNGTSSGESTVPDHIQVIQANYTPRMAYENGVCVARDLAVVTRLEATEMTGSEDAGPEGRPWLGWTMDAAGTVRRIADLTAAQARSLGQDNGFVPPGEDLIQSSDQKHAWQFLRPIGPIGIDAVLATGCLRYEESYVRRPTVDERPYYTVGQAGYNNDHKAEPVTDGPLRWFYDGSTAPVQITERRAVFIFCTVLVKASGIVSISVTGSSAARSTQLSVQRDGFYENLPFKLFRRFDGSYDAIWKSHPDYGRYMWLGATNTPTQYVTSPNGWRTPIQWPVFSQTASAGDGQVISEYMPTWFYPNRENLGSDPPKKPEDWDDEVQGPWVVPPYDVDESAAWFGMRYYVPSTGQFVHSTSMNNVYSDWGMFGRAAKVNPLYPQGPYARDGAGQWFGNGEWIVARHANGAMSAHEAGKIVPGVETGPYGGVDPVAQPDGRNPVMRMLQWPGRSWRYRLTQDGTWTVSSDGVSWSTSTDLGQVLGTISESAKLSEAVPE
tara:strand:+ start:451 stop:2388 length:1938 start_codon:yes stop_codon:yes gene_type:complete